MDMNYDSTRLLEENDIDTLSLNDIIYAKLTDAVRIVSMEAPLHLLEQGHQFGRKNIFWKENGKGWIILPDDFMRLVIFKMSDWNHPVNEVINEDNPLYLRQFSKWKGICGNPEKPVVAIVNRAEGKVLGGIDVSERCYKAAVYRAASLALASLNDQQTTTMLELSKSLLT